MMSAYACMGVIFAAPAAATAFAKSRPQSLDEVFSRAGQAAGYGEGLALTMLAAGVATVNLTRRGPMFLPEIGSLSASLLLGLTATLTMSLFTGWITLRFSRVAAQLATRLLFLVLLLAFFFRAQKLPEIGVAGSLVCLGGSTLLAYLLYREVNPR